MVLGFPVGDLVFLIGVSLLICITVCTLAMEAAVLFVPAFLFLFPKIVEGFPQITPNEAIGLAITVEFFGYTSSVLGYWFRKQIDIQLGLRILAITVPFAIAARVGAFYIPGEGLLVVFGVVLLALAWILMQSYFGGIRHTCLLCGDSIATMRTDDEGGDDPADKSLNNMIDPVTKRPRMSQTVQFNGADKTILSNAGVLAGVIGVAIGEITNTFLSIRKNMPIKVATGTAALVLHVTILAALCANLVVIFGDFSFIDTEDIVIPWKIAFILAPVVIIGGQIGSMINSKLSDHALARSMIAAYTLVGGFVLFNVVRSWLS